MQALDDLLQQLSQEQDQPPLAGSKQRDGW